MKKVKIKTVKLDYDATEVFTNDNDARLLLKKDAQDGVLTVKISIKDDSHEHKLLIYKFILNQYPLAVIYFYTSATELTLEDLRQKFDGIIRNNYSNLGIFLALQCFLNDNEWAKRGIDDLVKASNEVLKSNFDLKELQANIKRRCFMLNFWKTYDCDDCISVTFKKDGLIDKEIKVDKETYNTKVEGNFTQRELKELLEVEDAIVGFLKNHC